MDIRINSYTQNTRYPAFSAKLNGEFPGSDKLGEILKTGIFKDLPDELNYISGGLIKQYGYRITQTHPQGVRKGIVFAANSTNFNPADSIINYFERYYFHYPLNTIRQKLGLNCTNNIWK